MAGAYAGLSRVFVFFGCWVVIPGRAERGIVPLLWVGDGGWRVFVVMLAIGGCFAVEAFALGPLVLERQAVWVHVCTAG